MTKKTLVCAPLFLMACGSAQEPAEAPAPVPAPSVVQPDTAAPAEGQSEPLEPGKATAPEGSDLQAAPAFTLQDVKGNEVSLADFQGKTVVLEWFNPDCPFIKYAHGEGPLKALSESLTGGGEVVWLAINSGATGKQGAALEKNQTAASEWNLSYPLLLDPEGTVGQAYGAKSTPHMFVIDSEGNIVYRGALDNAPLGKSEGEYVNYVEKALADLAGGRAVATAETKSYGCSVKY